MDRCIDEKGKEGGHEGGNGKLSAYLDMYLYQRIDRKEGCPGREEFGACGRNGRK